MDRSCSHVVRSVGVRQAAVPVGGERDDGPEAHQRAVGVVGRAVVAGRNLRVLTVGVVADRRYPTQFDVAQVHRVARMQVLGRAKLVEYGGGRAGWNLGELLARLSEVPVRGDSVLVADDAPRLYRFRVPGYLRAGLVGEWIESASQLSRLKRAFACPGSFR